MESAKVKALLAQLHGVGTASFDQDDREIIFSLAELLAENELSLMQVDRPEKATKYLIAATSHLECEYFGIMFLDNKHRLIAHNPKMFRGTIDAAAVYPREVVKETLKHNAAAVILHHNHPSGEPEPSESDRAITRRLKEALALIDVRILDHIVVGGKNAVSLAERGWL